MSEPRATRMGFTYSLTAVVGIPARALWRCVLCIALALLSGCPASPPANPAAKPAARAEPEPVQKFPEVSARYAEPGELPRDGSSLVIELEVPPIPAKLLAPAPPIAKECAKR